MRSLNGRREMLEYPVVHQLVLDSSCQSSVSAIPACALWPHSYIYPPSCHAFRVSTDCLLPSGAQMAQTRESGARGGTPLICELPIPQRSLLSRPTTRQVASR